MSEKITTAICQSTAEDVFIRGKSLTEELIGKVSFTELMLFQILGREPSAAQVAVVDACLVTIMEHGLTPTAIATRLTYTSAPEAMQGAVAAGLSSVGSLFVGTMEGAAALLDRIVASDDADAEATAIVREHSEARARLPGFGHPIHKPDDPRTPALLAVAEAHGVAGARCAALKTLSVVVDRERGKHLTVNATGAIAACLGDCGVPAEIMRGFALIARCAGLVGHIREEQQRPAMKALWLAGEEAVPFQSDANDPPKEDPQ
jgi:citrate synthase